MSDWSETFDEQTQRSYYFNSRTKETRWTPPDEGGAINSPRPRTALEASQFVEAQDPETGRTYFYNPATREVSWTPPAGEKKTGDGNPPTRFDSNLAPSRSLSL